MKRNRKATAVFLLASLLAVSVNACTSKAEEKTEKTETVEIPVIFQVDPASYHKSNEELVVAFNQEYEGRYQIKVQWMFDTTSAYRSQIKLLNVTDELPAILTDVAFSPAFSQFLVQEGRLVDLSEEISDDPEWQSWIEDDILNSCYEEDGSLYMIPISSNCFSCSGIFYNKELFAKAGISEFPDTWEEFWKCCDRLSRAGITPLALHTEGTGWAPMLLATAYLGGDAAGEQFLRQRLPERYDGFGETMGKVLSQAFRYTTDDAVNRDFDVAYSHFIKEEAAMLPNGYWMINQLDHELAEKIGFAPFPGNVLILSPQMSGWAVTAGYPEEVQKGAVEFLRFRSQSTRAQADEFLDEEKIASSSLEADYLAALKNNPGIVANYQIQWNPILQEEVLPSAMGKLARGEIDPTVFTDLLNNSVERFESEQ